MNTIMNLIENYKSYLCYERSLSETTVKAYVNDLAALGSFLPGKDVQDITLNDLRAYMQHLTQQVNVRTVHRKFNGFATFWRWLRMDGLVTEVLTERLILPKLPVRIPVWLSESDLIKFVETPVKRDQRKWLIPRDQTALRLLAWLGLRNGELRNIKVEDVLLSEDLIVIRKTKNKRDRILLLPNQLKNDVIWLMRRKRPTDYLFAGDWGGYWSKSSFMNVFYRHIKTCELEGKRITPHTLRHTFATHLIRRKATLAEVQALLGHVDIKSTMVYVHMDIEQLKETMALHVLNK